MTAGALQKHQARLALGVVLERRAVDNPWIDHSWRPVAVIPGAGPLAPDGDWLLLEEGPGWARFHAGTLSLDLFRRETEGYRLNLSQRPPRLYVVLRPVEEAGIDHELLPFLVTACPYEAQDYLDSGEEQVETIAMPEAVVAFVQHYVDQHHVDEPFYKRKRKRYQEEPESFARKPGASRLKPGNGEDG